MNGRTNGRGLRRYLPKILGGESKEALFQDPSLRRVYDAIGLDSLLACIEDEEKRKDFYANSYIRLINQVWGHIVEDKRHMLSGATPIDLYNIIQASLTTTNYGEVEKPIKVLNKGIREGTINSGRYWRIGVYEPYASNGELLPEIHDNLKLGILEKGDTIIIDSGLAGGKMAYKVNKIDAFKKGTPFSTTSWPTDLRFEMHMLDCIRQFGETDAEDTGIETLAGKDEPGWFLFNIRRERRTVEPPEEEEIELTHRHGGPLINRRTE